MYCLMPVFYNSSRSHLVNPKSLHDGNLVNSFGNGQLHALDDAIKISQVEHIMRLAWSRQENLLDFLEDAESTRYYGVCEGSKLS